MLLIKIIKFALSQNTKIQIFPRILFGIARFSSGNFHKLVIRFYPENVVKMIDELLISSSIFAVSEILVSPEGALFKYPDKKLNSMSMEIEVEFS